MMQSNILIHLPARFWLISLLAISNCYLTYGQFASSDEVFSFRELDPDPRLYELMRGTSRQQPALSIETGPTSDQQGYFASPSWYGVSNDLAKPSAINLASYLIEDEYDQQRNQRQDPKRTVSGLAPLDIDGPINDPAQAMETYGKLTNSNNQSSLLDLMDLYFDAMMQRQVGNWDQSRIDQRLRSDARDQLDSSDDDDQVASSTTSASRYGNGEYIDHPLALAGHQYVQGGAGEGRQLLGPDGDFENKQVIKSDSAVPSHCNPPNPCPKGFTAADGCLEEFVNSASFSREYQIKQKCSCDNEHSLFDCDSPIDSLRPNPSSVSRPPTAPYVSNDLDEANSERLSQQQEETLEKIDTLARTIQNRFGNIASIQNLIADHHQQSGGHHVVSRRIDT